MTLAVDPARYLAYLGIMAVMAATPGPANLFSIAKGVGGGGRAVLAGVAGMLSGTLVWFSAAALGLGALVIAFPKTFHLLTYAGCAYLVWLGAKSFLAGLRVGKSSHDFSPSLQPGSASAIKAFREGFTVQITNPKAVVFFSAVLPPFIDPLRPIGPQLALFAAANVVMDFVTMNAYGLGGAALAHKMTEPRFQRGFSLAVGALLICAAGLILTQH